MNDHDPAPTEPDQPDDPTGDLGSNGPLGQATDPVGDALGPDDAAAAAHDPVGDEDEADLARRWVEIREEGSEDTRVFVPDGPDVPLGRGRLILDLTDQRAVSARPGPTDAPIGTTGEWVRDEDRMTLSVPEFEGSWTIVDLTDERLELRRRD